MPDSPFPLLAADVELHACMTCAAAVPAKGLDMHETWHQRIAASAVDAHLRIDRLTALLEQVSGFNAPRPPHPTDKEARHDR